MTGQGWPWNCFEVHVSKSSVLLHAWSMPNFKPESVYHGDKQRETHSQKEHTEFCKITKFGVNWANIDQDTST